MPTIYLRKDLYDALVKSGIDPNAFVNSTVEAALKRKEVIKKLQETRE